jgi:CRISPR/Cas system-associated exonuclease Cas4 (RecB family)
MKKFGLERDIIRMFIRGMDGAMKREAEELQQEMITMIESVKVDFDDVFNFVSLIKSTGRDPSIEEYQNFFYKEWKKNVPLLFIKIMEDAAENDIQSAIDFREMVFGMGSKFRAVTESKFCVFVLHPSDCEKCYFRKVCKIDSNF